MDEWMDGPILLTEIISDKFQVYVEFIQMEITV